MKLFSSYHSLSRARRMTVMFLLWLLPLVLGWAGLIVLSHQTTQWAILWTQRLFGWMLLMTYVGLWILAIGFSRQPRLTVFRGIAGTITLSVLILCLEVPAFLKFVHWGLVFDRISGEPQNYVWAYLPDNELDFRRRPNDHWEGLLSSDIEFGWLLPRSRQEPLVFTYDQWGYRNSMNLNHADVALIGDSYVEGWYVSDTETTAQRLQTHLGRPVINLGVAGYGTQQEFLVLKKDAIQFNPKVVIFFFFEGNDLYDDNRFEKSVLSGTTPVLSKHPNPLGLAWTKDRKQSSFTYNVLRRFRRFSNSVLPNNYPYSGQLTTPGQSGQIVHFADYASKPWSEFEAGRWKKTRDTLAQVSEISKTQGIHVLFTFVPIKFRVYQPFVIFPPDSPCVTWRVWPTTELFLEFCQSTGVPCLDLTKPFQEHVRGGGMPYSPVDSHWSPQGHAFVADLLAAELSRRGWLTDVP